MTVQVVRNSILHLPLMHGSDVQLLDNIVMIIRVKYLRALRAALEAICIVERMKEVYKTVERLRRKNVNVVA